MAVLFSAAAAVAAVSCVIKMCEVMSSSSSNREQVCPPTQPSPDSQGGDTWHVATCKPDSGAWAVFNIARG